MPHRLSIATIRTAHGARIGFCRLPGSTGNLQADLEAILRWKPRIVVSMTEQSEMDRCGSGDIGSLLEARGVAWAHFPIRDYHSPDAGSDACWPGLSRRLHGILAEGGGTVLHCRGGLGRSGMVAMKLLVEQGESAAEALDRVRLARPGAIETEGQLAWASARGV